jgi:hypothetical protein
MDDALEELLMKLMLSCAVQLFAGTYSLFYSSHGPLPFPERRLQMTLRRIYGLFFFVCQTVVGIG